MLKVLGVTATSKPTPTESGKASPRRRYRCRSTLMIYLRNKWRNHQLQEDKSGLI